jgi:hypothetical protein
MIPETCRPHGVALSLAVVLSLIYDENCYAKRKRYLALPKKLPQGDENSTTSEKATSH